MSYKLTCSQNTGVEKGLVPSPFECPVGEDGLTIVLV